MDALMAAFVAALLAQASDRTPWLTAILSTRYGKPGTVILASALALAVINGAAAVGGMLIGPRIAPNAQLLLLALSLLSAGVPALFPIKLKDRLSGWKVGAFLTSLLGVLVLGLGDRTQFLTFAIAAGSPAPILAAVGATLGAVIVNTAAILAGEAARKSLPIVAIRIGVGVLFVILGAIFALQALRLI